MHVSTSTISLSIMKIDAPMTAIHETSAALTSCGKVAILHLDLGIACEDACAIAGMAMHVPMLAVFTSTIDAACATDGNA